MDKFSVTKEELEFLIGSLAIVQTAISAMLTRNTFFNTFSVIQFTIMPGLILQPQSYLKNNCNGNKEGL